MTVAMEFQYYVTIHADMALKSGNRDLHDDLKADALDLVYNIKELEDRTLELENLIESVADESE